MANRGRENLILHGERFGSIPWLLESRRCSSYPIREPKKLASLGREIEPILCRIPPVLRDERNVTRVQVPSASCLLHWVSYPPTLGAWRGSAMRPECPELRGCYLAAAQLEQLKAGRDVAETELRWHMSRRHRLFRAMVPGPWSPCPASGHTNLPHSGLNGTESATGLDHVEGRKTRPPRRAGRRRTKGRHTQVGKSVPPGRNPSLAHNNKKGSVATATVDTSTTSTPSTFSSPSPSSSGLPTGPNPNPPSRLVHHTSKHQGNKQQAAGRVSF